ncbi:hypothetical protein [Brevibacterium sediminis]|uniref:Uncharacterized protein n=1 Tax=Brevibacterium sediminis TaxID=1857024 RepID=A0A5C4WZY4_9MICO|nr:hypothetical protein [Brevibacterium sediminis]TNM52879.1 hypothetical protein FHQ09_17340 [Brevibacterium sediminis]
MSADNAESLDSWRLSVLVGKIYEIQEADEPFRTPTPGSRLADADVKLDPFPATNAVQQLLAVSGDNLHSVALLLHKAEAHQPFAPYTLIRASLESTGFAMWLLSGRSREGIALNALRLEWENKKNRVLAFPKDDGPGETWEERRERLILAAGDRFGLQPKLIKEKPLSFAAVSIGSEFFGLDPVMLSAWKGASGAAHGRSWATLALADHEIVPGSETESGASYRATGNTRTLVSLLYVAVAAHDALEEGFNAMLQGRSTEVQRVAQSVITRLYIDCRIGDEG